MAFNEDGFYKVVLKGRHGTNNVVNVLWYKVGLDVLPGDLSLAGADVLAGLVKTQVWGAGMRAIAHQEYLLDKIEVYPHDNDFAVITQLPYILEVGEYGQNTGTLNGTAPCAILRFNLEPTGILSGFFPPKRGYLAFGPLLDTYINNDGTIEASAFNALNTMASKFAGDLVSLVPPCTFEPIRVKVTRTLGGLVTLQGYAGISSCTVNHRASFRRSRLGESA